MLALDPLACGEIWADGAHSCVRDEKHQGVHRCDCGKTRRAAPKKKPRAKKPTMKQLVKQADDLARDLCRSRGVCEMQVLRPELRCSELLQWCHIVRRRFYSVRWASDNCLAGCSAHHTYFSHNPEAWALALEKEWPGRYQELWERAQKPWKSKDIDAVISALQSLSEEGALK